MTQRHLAALPAPLELEEDRSEREAWEALFKAITGREPGYKRKRANLRIV
jgi:hypothetical protein